MNTRTSSGRALGGLQACILSACIPMGVALAAPSTALQTTPYSSLSQRTQDFTNFNVETTRGMAIDGADLWSINTHGSQLVHTDLSSSTFPTSYGPTILNPIAVATWQDYVLVLGGATHALVLHDSQTGDIVGLIDLIDDAPEPGDIVVDHDNDWAYVSGMGNNEVVRIDLNTRTVIGNWPVASLKPRFLYLDLVDTEDPTDNVLYVTPQLSGNNSTVATNPSNAEEGIIVDLDGQAVELPDEDLFRIPPGLASGAPAQAVFRKLSTILTAHGRNPLTGQYWMLSYNLNNKDENGLGLDTEPELNGIFIDNQLDILPDPRGVTGVLDMSSNLPVSLDDLHGVPAASDIVASNPWDLVFDSVTGIGFISSPTGNLVRLMGTAGQRLLEIDTGPGTIPRSLQLYQIPGFTFLLVYCWGTNEIQVHQVFPSLSAGPVKTIDLGLDPTPPMVAAGRTIFYDADFSFESRSTCASCHVGGEYDGLAWPIENRPKDHKDVMVTQNLKSIQDTFPFHWRGERSLIDFNGAFTGLLGGPRELKTAPGDEFDQFKAFVFSLQSMANPNARIERELDNLDATGLASPANGQATFLNVPTAGSNTCSDCHGLPNGSRNDYLPNEGTVATMMNMEIAHLRDLTWKDNPAVSVSFIDPFNPSQTVTTNRSRNGFGLLHNGRISNIQEFMLMFQAQSTFSNQERDDLASFLRQFDRGISRAAHKAYFIEQGTPTTTVSMIDSVLAGQALAGWVGIVAMGTYPVAGTPTALTWFYDPATQLFHANHASGLTATTQDFLNQANLGLAQNVIFGVPDGMAEYLGSDFDHDGADGPAEIAAGSDPFDPDSDGDGYPDGYELVQTPPSDPTRAASTPVDNRAPAVVAFDKLLVTASLGVFRLEANEPVTYRITWWPVLDPGGSTGVFARSTEGRDPALVHTIVLQGLLSGSVVNGVIEPQVHNIQVQIFDLSGNPKTDPTIYSMQPLPIIDLNDSGPPLQAPTLSPAITELSQVGVSRTGSTIDLQVKAKVMFRGGILTSTPGFPNGVPLPGYRVIAQILTEDLTGLAEGNWNVSSNFDAKQPLSKQFTNFQFEGVNYSGLPGKFLVSDLTDANGEVILDFAQSGLTGGQEVSLNVIAILPGSLESTPGPNGEPNYDKDPFTTNNDSIGLLGLYRVGATAPDKRCFTISF